MKKSIYWALMLVTICLFTSSIYSQATTYGLINGSGMVITNVNLSQPGMNSWGANINTAGNISADESIKFTHSPEENGCVVDIRYSGKDGKYYYIQNFDLCGPTSAVLLNPFTKSDDKVKTDPGKTENTGKVKQSEERSQETITNTNQPVDNNSIESKFKEDKSGETKSGDKSGDVKSYDSGPIDNTSSETPVDGKPTDEKPSTDKK